tara:strand:- start:189 stop:371 length:183 start_codon:yes stop_codon:yes gene_type:complete
MPWLLLALIPLGGFLIWSFVAAAHHLMITSVLFLIFAVVMIAIYLPESYWINYWQTLTDW